MNTDSLKREIEALKEENRALVELDAKKQALVNMIIHDLKGPLGEVISNLDILTYCKTLEPDDREVLDTAIRGGSNLLAMVMNLLDIAKIEDGSLQLNLGQVDINLLVKEKTAAMKVIADQKNLVMETSLKTDLPIVQGDREILERVLSNLIGNAISYSREEGKIVVRTDQEENFVKISICDHGRGIPPKYHNRIFEKFGQVRAGDGRRHGSTGLGLTFCKMAVEAHSGSIGVKSEQDKGSEFYFSLPVSSESRK